MAGMGSDVLQLFEEIEATITKISEELGSNITEEMLIEAEILLQDVGIVSELMENMEKS